MGVRTRQDLLGQIFDSCELDGAQQEDVEIVVDVLLEAFTPRQIGTWLCFYDEELDGLPVLLLDDGELEHVRRRARRMVAIRAGEL